ncbi:MAG: hypothetical protein QM813_26425 [Verrucomicrobiota bacterium]
MIIGQPCCCEDSCPPIFGIIELRRPGFRALTGTSSTRWLGQFYSYDYSYFRDIPGSFPPETELRELHYDLTISIDRWSGQVTMVENSNLESGEMTTMYSQLGTSPTTTSADYSEGGSGTLAWQIELSGPCTFDDDCDYLSGITDDALDLIADIEAETLFPYGYRMRVGYEFYSNVVWNMAPFTHKATLDPYTAPLDPDLKILSQQDGLGTYAALGTWWFGNPSVSDGSPPTGTGPRNYPCEFYLQAVNTVPLGGSTPPSTVYRCFIKIGTNSVCGQIHRINLDGNGVQSSTASMCITGSDGLLLFPNPSSSYVTTFKQDSNLTAPGSLTAGDCPCSNAP